jgi:hypothetical protein
LRDVVRGAALDRSRAIFVARNQPVDEALKDFGFGGSEYRGGLGSGNDGGQHRAGQQSAARDDFIGLIAV